MVRDGHEPVRQNVHREFMLGSARSAHVPSRVRQRRADGLHAAIAASIAPRAVLPVATVLPS